MDWLLLALIPPLVWGIATIFDKVLVSRYVSGMQAGILTNLFSAILPLLFVPFFPINKAPSATIAWLIIAGILWGCARLFYCIAVSKEEASRVIPIIQISPVFILFISLAFLKDSINLLQALGFISVLAGVLWISVRKKEKKVHFTKAIIELTLHVVSITFSFIILKAYSNLDWWTSLVFINLGFILSTIPFIIYQNNWKEIINKVKSKSGPIVFNLFSIALMAFIGRATFFSALPFAPVAIVSILSSTQALVVFILVTIFSVKMPSIIKEEVNLKIFVSKAAAILLILLGIAILAFA